MELEINNSLQIEVKLEFPDFFEKKCRVCLLEGTLFIFSEESDLLESIELFGDINISQDDAFPKYLCKSCHCLLQSAILFRQKAQETNTNLLKGFEQNNFSLLADVKNKPEENMQTIKSECSNLSENTIWGNKFVKSEGPNVSENNILNTPEENKHSVKRETSTVSRNAKNTLKGNMVIKSERSKYVTISVVKDTPGGKASVKNAKTNASYSKKIYECVSCKIEFSKKKDYCSHKKSKHSRIQCPVCKKLASAQRFKRHLESHETDSYVVCEVCGKLYQKGAIAKHLLLHSNNLPFPCKVCPYRGRCSESIKLHMRMHTGHKPYTCEICQMSFITKSNLNRHSLTHSKLRPHKCVECNKGFCTNRDLVIHIKKDHEGIKDFECKLCGNKYGAKRVLRKHELRVHKRDKMVPGRKPLYLQPEYKT